MPKFFNNGIVKFLLISLISVLCLIAGITFFFWWKQQASIDAAYTVARQLGHTSQSHLVQTEHCWDIFPSHCGVFVHFTTDLSLDEMQSLLDRLNFSENWFGEIDGYSIFTNINLESDRNLTANGNEGLENRLVIQKPLAYKWSLADKQNRNWNIYFYNTVVDGNEYKIDDQTLNENIVTVMLQTK